MKELLLVCLRRETPNSWSLLKLIEGRFGVWFDMTHQGQIWVFLHTKSFGLGLWFFCEMRYLLTEILFSLLPKTITSFLSWLNWREFWFSKQWHTDSWIWTVASEDIAKFICVAYSLIRVLQNFTQRYHYRLNRRGARSDPRVIPHVIATQSDW